MNDFAQASEIEASPTEIVSSAHSLINRPADEETGGKADLFPTHAEQFVTA